MLNDKENEVESERLNLKRQLIQERKKLHAQREAANKAKEEFEKRKAVMNKELLHLRDHMKQYQEVITKLKQENSEIKFDLFHGPEGPLSQIEARIQSRSSSPTRSENESQLYLPEKDVGSLLSPISHEGEETLPSSRSHHHHTHLGSPNGTCGMHWNTPKKLGLNLPDSHHTEKPGKPKCMACKIKQIRRDEEASKERVQYFDATQLLKYKTMISGIVCSHCNSIFDPNDFLKHGRRFRGVTAAAAQFEKSMDKQSSESNLKSERSR